MADSQAFGEASSALTRLADGLRQDGNTIGADFLIDAAARVELLSDDLQNCWGGPFNGQTWRQLLALKTLDKTRPRRGDRDRNIPRNHDRVVRDSLRWPHIQLRSRPHVSASGAAQARSLG